MESAVRVYGDAAVVVGRSRMTVAQAGGARQQLPVRFTDVYVRRDGRWRMVAWQSTRAPE